MLHFILVEPQFIGVEVEMTIRLFKVWECNLGPCRVGGYQGDTNALGILVSNQEMG
jgi:hypothetical protein